MSKLLFLHSNYDSIIYRVSEGENLFDVARKFNQTPQQIIRQNHLTQPLQPNSLIYVEVVDGHQYVVRVGETLDEIAKRFKISAEQISTLNQVKYLYPYQIILLQSKIPNKV